MDVAERNARESGIHPWQVQSCVNCGCVECGDEASLCPLCTMYAQFLQTPEVQAVIDRAVDDALARRKIPIASDHIESD